MTNPRAVTAEEWAALRRESLHGLPAGLDGKSLPDVLLPYQQTLLATTAANRVTVVEKSRRTGFTWALGADAVLVSATARQAGGMDTLYIGYNLDMAREFVDVAAMWARLFHQAAGAVEEFLFDDGPDSAIKAFRISFASGFEIVALSSKPRSLRGRQGYVIIDEAAFHDDLPGLMKAALALLIWGGKVVVISTHEGDDNHFNQLVTDIRAGRRPYALIRCDFDEALRQGLYDRVCLATGESWSPEAEAEWRAAIIAEYGEDADEELFCIPAKGKGAYIPAPLIEARMQQGIPVLRWEMPSSFNEWPQHLREAEANDWCERHLKPHLTTLDPHLLSFFGEDFGRVSNLTVIWPLQLSRTMRRLTPFVVELANIPFEQQKQVLFYIGDRLPRRMAGAMDATGNGAYLAEVAAQRYGLERVEQVKLTVEWYRENMPRLKAAFEDDAIVIPADAEIMGDLRMIKMVNGVGQVPNADRKSADGQKRHGDAAIALALAYYATVMPIVEYDYTSGRAPDPAEPRRREDHLRPVRVTAGFKERQGVL
jgi:phage FluMu gp28-like protein